MSFTKCLRLLLASLLTGILVLQPTLAWAGSGVVVDGAAPPANRPTLDNAANGVPQVNIVAPNAAGLSHNKFSDFNVSSQGLILNNSAVTGTSKLGGLVLGNANLTNGSARTILSEVTGVNPSQLLGAIEVFGPSAAFILANPNGVTCAGCGFINTPRATLSTGTPLLDGAGNLSGLTVDRGQIVLDGATLDVTGLDFFDIVSRTASLNAAIKGQDIGIHTGANRFDYNSRTSTSLGGVGTGVSLDSSLIGGLYANRITLVGTDRGVGVNLQGDISAANHLTLSADGRVQIRRAASGGDMALTSNSSEVTLNDTTHAQGALTVSGVSIVNNAVAGAAGDVTVGADSITNNGQLVAGLATDGTVSGGTLSVSANQVTNSQNAVMQSGAQTALTAGVLSNGGTISSLGNVQANVGSLDNSGALNAGQNLSVAAQGALLSTGVAQSSGQMVMSAGGPMNFGSAAQIKAGQAVSLSAIGDLSSQATLQAGSGATFSSGGALALGGDIQAAGPIDMTAGQAVLSGRMKGGAGLHLHSQGGMTLSGQMTAHDALVLDGQAADISGQLGAGADITFSIGGQALLSNAAILSAATSLTITANSFASAGQVGAGGLLALNASTINNQGTVQGISEVRLTTADLSNSGTIGSGGDLTAVSSGSLTNSGTLNAYTTLTATAGRFSNSGVIAANDTASLHSSGDLGNDGKISSGAALDLTAGGTVSNAGTIVGSGSVTLQGDALTTNSGSSLSSTGTLTLKGNSLSNNGSVTAMGDTALTVSGAANNGGTLAAGNALSIQAQTLNNSGQINGGADITLTNAGDLTNSGTLSAYGALQATIGSLSNVGQIASNKAMAFQVGAGGVDSRGRISSGTTLNITSTGGSITNGGTVVAGDDTTVQADGDFSNHTGASLAAGGTLAVTGRTLSNSGTLGANGNVTLQTGGVLNNSGSLMTAQALLGTLGSLANSGVVMGGSVDLSMAGGFSSSGQVSSKGRAHIAAASLTNASNARMESGDDTTLSIVGALNNAGELVSNGQIALSATSLTNGIGATFASDKTVTAILSADFINNGILSSGQNTQVTSAAISNGGKIVGSGNLTLTGSGALTNSGVIAGQGNVATEAASITNTSSATLAAVGALAFKTRQLTNNGQMGAGQGTSLQVDQAFNNTGTLTVSGTVSGTVGSLSNSGQLASGATSLAMAGALTNSGALTSAGASSLQAATLANARGATLASGGLMTAILTGDVVNDGTLSMGSVDLRTTGRIINNGGLISGGDMALQATALGNYGSPGLSAAGSIRAAITGTIDNQSTVVSGGDIAFTGLTNLSNTGLMVSKNGLSVEASNTISNSGGSLIAQGNMSLTGTGGVAALAINNLGGSLQTVHGDMQLNAVNVYNQIMGGTVETVNAIVYDKTSQGDHSVPLGPCPLDKGCGYFGYWTWVPNPKGNGAGSWYGSSSTDLPVRSYVVRSGTTINGGQAAEIASGGALRITGTNSLQNLYSTISSTGSMVLAGGSLSNLGASSTDTWYVTVANSTMTRCYYGPCAFFGNGGGTAVVDSWGTARQGGRIAAGGSLTASFTGTIDNTSIFQGTLISAPSGSAVTPGTPLAVTSSDGSSAASGQSVVQVRAPNGGTTALGTGHVDVDHPLTLTGAVDVLRNVAQDKSLIQTATGPLSLSDLSGLLSRRIAGFSSQFAAAPASHPFLYETRFTFTDLGTFYGSDYFFSRMQMGSSSLPKRLGDAYLETQLIRSAVVAQTGQRFLDVRYADDSQQMKALLDGAVAESGALGLTVGQAPTAAQLASLDRDIIWYVTETVNGQPVLTPRLYLAQTDRLNSRGATIAAGGDMSISGGSVLNNQGAITAGGSLALQAQQSVVNVSGRIAAGGAANISALTGDVQNVTQTVTLQGGANDIRTVTVGKGEITAGAGLSVSAGRDVVLSGASLQSGGATTITAGRDVSLGAITQLDHHADNMIDRTAVTHAGSSVTAGGGVAITAGQDVGIDASTVQAGGSAAITAGRDVTLSAQADTLQSHSWEHKSASSHDSWDNTSKTVSSSVTAGGTVAVTAGNDLTLQAAKLSSGGETALTAGGTVALQSTLDSDYHAEQNHRESMVWQSSQDKGHDNTTVVMTDIRTNTATATNATASATPVSAPAAGSGLRIQAGKGISADIRSNGDLTQSITALASQPGTAWVGQLAQRPDVNWRPVAEAHRQWDYQSQGLTGAGAAIIAIAVTIATQGAGAGALEMLMGQAAAESTVGVAMTQAAISTLASQASVSLINNQGDIGKVLKEMGSSSSLRNLAAAVATAGMTAELNAGLGLNPSNPRADTLALQSGRAAVQAGVGTVVRGAVYGGDLGNILRQQIVSAAGNVAAAQGFGAVGDMAQAMGIPDGSIDKALAHALVGGTVAKATGGDFLTAATAAAAAELSSPLLDQVENKERRDALAGLVGGVAAALAGGDGKAVNSAANLATLEQQNNRDLHPQEKLLNRALAVELSDKTGRTASEELEILNRAACVIAQCNAGTAALSPTDPAYLERVGELAQLYPHEMALIAQLTGIVVGDYGPGLDKKTYTYTQAERPLDTDVPITPAYPEDVIFALTGLPGAVKAGLATAMELAGKNVASKELIFGRKLDFLFNNGIDQSNAYNAARAAGNAERIGIADTPLNREEVINRFNHAYNDPSSIVGPGNIPGSNLREFFLPGVTSTGSKIQFVEMDGRVITIMAK